MAGGAEAGDRRGVLCSGLVGVNGCSTLRRECDQVAPMPLFKRLQATKLLTGEACSLVSQYASGQHPWQARWSSAKRSGSNGGLGPLVHLPIPGKQIGAFVGGVIWKPGQHVSEPGLRIDVVHLAGFDQGINGGR